MCSTCGCNETDTISLTTVKASNKEESIHYHPSHGNGHDHHHEKEEHHQHESSVVQIERDILSKNNLIAERNKGYFEGKEILALNLVSSPGSGKTTLLEQTCKHLFDRVPCSVIEGDQQSLNDAQRISKTRVPVVQINTGNACHLDAEMTHKALHQLNPENNSILFIENVGNLVCPALFDLGEEKRVLIMSVTEGEDKPIKYPGMFHSADICIINKTDLLPYVPFDVKNAKEYALRVNPKLKFLELSSLTGEGMEAWFSWINKCRKK